ncbi:DUF6544 family protein [Breoghania sp.]|uniref:DUF6920 family protein n=1 Tax=Breoghania sp. TaxID=2065378 RepID=UPI002619FC32|nr:DUF6544 family protein [Breoghania sp.]MDJ0931512.1 hypothetical protein [Breoghania sp.]
MKALKFLFLALLIIIVAIASFLSWGIWRTGCDIAALEDQVRERASAPRVTPDQMAALPDGTDGLPAFVRIKAAGDFRRLLTENFQPTSAEQIISTRSPDFVFHATTPIPGPIWAAAYDGYVAGRMEMRAKLVSAITLLHFTNDAQLDRLSLRRWLLEASSWPPALLPDGPVIWQAIDDSTARALVSDHGITENMIARFDASGALIEMSAEEDGDLTTPYHGPGEHVESDDYRLREGVRHPTELTISRAAAGKHHPFWRAKVTEIEFGPRE